jgi:hypothetical protein
MEKIKKYMFYNFLSYLSKITFNGSILDFAVVNASSFEIFIFCNFINDFCADIFIFFNSLFAHNFVSSFALVEFVSYLSKAVL